MKITKNKSAILIRLSTIPDRMHCDQEHEKLALTSEVCHASPAAHSESHLLKHESMA